MKILLVNDDGIAADGLKILAEAASCYGDVWVVAPAGQCSAMSQRITVRRPMELKQIEDYPYVKAAYSLEGMPADCVKVGINYILKEKPDYVFAGINHGHNTGFDICYSGTVGAAIEGLLAGVKAAAFSTDMPGSFDITVENIKTVMGKIIADDPGQGCVWNVNFPSCDPKQLKGIMENVKVAPMQVFDESISGWRGEYGRLYVCEDGARYRAEMFPENTDARAVLEGYITIGRVWCGVLSAQMKNNI